MNIGLVRSQVNVTPLDQKVGSDLFRSNYIPNSHFPDHNPEVYHTFFHDQPLKRYSEDISRLRPVSYQSPDLPYFKDKSFIIVEKKVNYGKPISREEFQRLIKSQKPVAHQIVTYGTGEKSEVLKFKEGGIPPREKVEIKADAERNQFCWCCAPSSRDDQKNYLVKQIK